MSRRADERTRKRNYHIRTKMTVERINELYDGRQRIAELEEALRKIAACTGTSTEAHHIAADALKATR